MQHEPRILKAKFFVAEPVQIPSMMGEPLLDGGQLTHQSHTSLPPANVQNVAGARDASNLAIFVKTIALGHPSSSSSQPGIAAGVVTDDRHGILQFEYVEFRSCPVESPVKYQWINGNSIIDIEQSE